MDIRCGKCNKLFRISDDKITGKGIKFACSKCGETVKVTQEDFERYTLSLSAVSVLDTFEPKPKTKPHAPEPELPKPESAGPKTEFPPDTALPGAEISPPLTDAPREPASSESAIPDFLQEREEPAAFESSPFIELPHEPAQQTAQLEPGNTLFEDSPKTPEQPQAPSTAPEPPSREKTIEETIAPEKPVPERMPETPVKAESPQPAIELKPTPVVEPVAQVKPEQKTESAAEPKPETKPEPKPEQKIEPPVQVKPAPAVQPKPKPAPAAPSQAQKRAPARPAAQQRPAVSAAPAAKARSGNMIIVIGVAVLLLGLIGFGAYFLLQPGPLSSSAQMTSIEGLNIENASGTPETNGDLLISGTVVNTTNKPQDAWLVVVDVFDAKGGVLKKIRLFKGKQLYTKNDYDVLQKRGVNIQELKTRLLSNQGTVIPQNGRVNIELRYLQPPIGIASFNATLQPYDPIRLEKEIAADAK
jgi:predicted Zn finger-like uncharacterized protein